MEIKKIIDIAREAGNKILEIYNQENFDVKIKLDSKGEESPLTKADIASNTIIENSLKKLYPSIPYLSEENKEIPYEERKNWEQFWLIDPLDGTKEFIKRNGEFTVNIALIKNNKPVLGVIFIPVKNICYYADENGAFKDGEKLSVKKENQKLIVVASRSHFNEETKEYIEKLGKPYELISSGSSLKFCLVAEGKADIYPRLGLTMEWDTAAAHAIVNAAGGKVKIQGSEQELMYNKENLLNPFFIVK